MTVAFYNAGSQVAVVIDGITSYIEKSAFTISVVGDGTNVNVFNGNTQPFLRFDYHDCTFPTSTSDANLVARVTTLIAVPQPITYSGTAETIIFVTLTGLAANDLLAWDGTKWVNVLPTGATFVTSVLDTNTIDLTALVGVLSAAVRHQDTATIDLSDDAGGLKADLSAATVADIAGKIPTALGTYTNVKASRAFATNYTPNVTRSTLVVATFGLACDDTETSLVDVLVAGTVIADVYNDFNVSGVLGVIGTSIIHNTVTFVVPPNTTYRFNNSGTGTESIEHIFELTL